MFPPLSNIGYTYSTHLAATVMHSLLNINCQQFTIFLYSYTQINDERSTTVETFQPSCCIFSVIMRRCTVPLRHNFSRTCTFISLSASSISMQRRQRKNNFLCFVYAFFFVVFCWLCFQLAGGSKKINK